MRHRRADRATHLDTQPAQCPKESVVTLKVALLSQQRKQVGGVLGSLEGSSDRDHDIEFSDFQD